MSTEYEIEALLRSPQEYWASINSFITGLLFLLVPEVFVVVPLFCYLLAAFCFWRSIHWLRLGNQLRNYHKGLSRTFRFVLSHKRMRYSTNYTFLGRGFRWERIHAQRLYDLSRGHKKYREPPPSHRLARAIERKVAGAPKRGVSNFTSMPLRGIARLTSNQKWWNPVPPSATQKGSPALHAVGQPDGETDVFLKTKARNTHTIVFGTSGSGKTRVLDLGSSQDVINNDVTIVIDPKGDTELLMNLYAAARKAGRENEMYCFHLGFPDESIAYNLLGNWQRVTEPATMLASLLPAEGQSLAFKQFSWQFVNMIQRTLVALGRQSDVEEIAAHTRYIDQLAVDYLDFHLESINHANGRWRIEVQEHIEAYATQRPNNRNQRTPAATTVTIRANALRLYYRSHRVEDPLAASLLRTLDMERSYLEKLVGSLQPLLEKLTSGDVGKLLSPRPTADNPIHVLNWSELIRTNGILYIGLDAMSDSEVSHAVGSAMLSGIASALGQIYKHGIQSGGLDATVNRRIMLHIDEVTEVISSDAIIQLANKGRGAGLHMTLYAQTLADFQVAFQKDAKAMQVIGNINNRIILQAQDVDTAEIITASLQEVDVDYQQLLSSHSDSSNPDSGEDFGTRTEQRNMIRQSALLHPGDLLKLPEGQGFAWINGGELWKIRIPLADPEDTRDLPRRPRELVAMVNRPHTSGTLQSNVSRAVRESHSQGSPQSVSLQKDNPVSDVPTDFLASPYLIEDAYNQFVDEIKQHEQESGERDTA